MCRLIPSTGAKTRNTATCTWSGWNARTPTRWCGGASYFRNSFGQPSGYLYGGKRYDSIFSYDKLFAQWTVGLLYGYKPPYDHKVPLNHNGFSPGAVVSLGWQFTPTYSAQVNVLGNSALMFQFSADFK